jgi:adenylate kinase
MTNLLIVGPPGAGKGTQACLLADTADMVNVSTGDMFHEHVTNLTALGVEAKAYMDTGKYAPDDLTGRMLSDRIADLGPDNGLILDGFPGTTAQVVSSMTSSTAGASPRPRGGARCTDRGRRAARRAARASVEGRTDDNATVVRRRHEVYAEQAAPLVDRYRARALVRDVAGTAYVERVATAISRHLSAAAVSQPEMGATNSSSPRLAPARRVRSP